RRHINCVKRGGDFFHILHQESLERSARGATQRDEGTVWRTECQPSMYCSATEKSEEDINDCSLTDGDNRMKLGNMTKKMTLRSFAPVYTSVLIPTPPGAKSEHLFRQLCAIHWLLEASTLESNSSMHSIFTCWNPMDPGGCKKTVKEIQEEKIARYMWELFISHTKKRTWKTRWSPLMRKINRVSTPGISQFSGQSSPRAQSPCNSPTSTLPCSEDTSKMNLSSSDIVSESAQAKEPDLLSACKSLLTANSKWLCFVFLGRTYGKDTARCTSVLLCRHTQLRASLSVPSLLADCFKDNIISCEYSEFQLRFSYNSCIISSSTKSKSNLCADVRQEFAAVREEAAACLHDTLEHLERSQEERCRAKFQALEHLTDFRKDMERMRQLGPRTEREHDEGRINWFPELLARLPASVKSDRYVQKILKKLERYGKNPDLRIEADAFLRALADVQVWELCSPDIAAAVEFVRESIVQMPEEDFHGWFQTRVARLSAQSPTIS
ncbi:CCD60 protein, partial [Columbina picui]|nr:CCD60 protein [Columbina picui]